MQTGALPRSGGDIGFRHARIFACFWTLSTDSARATAVSAFRIIGVFPSAAYPPLSPSVFRCHSSSAAVTARPRQVNFTPKRYLPSSVWIARWPRPTSVEKAFASALRARLTQV